MFYLVMPREDYQEPPPPPPEPPPDEPPPEPPPLSLEGLDDIAVEADAIVVVINTPNECILKVSVESYQLGACRAIVSN